MKPVVSVIVPVFNTKKYLKSMLRLIVKPVIEGA